jgi:hypothetical protein
MRLGACPWDPTIEVFVLVGVVTRLRNRGGNTLSSLARARTQVSSRPVVVPAAAVNRPVVIATASSSSNSSGEISAPASRSSTSPASRY